MRGRRKLWEGTIVRKDNTNTVVAEVTRRYPHPKYGKTIARRSRFFIHDPNQLGQVGAVVEFADTRPLSHNKRWIMVRVVKKARTSKVAVVGDVPEDVIKRKKAAAPVVAEAPAEVAK